MLVFGRLLSDLSVSRGLDNGKGPVEEVQDKVFELLRLAANLFLGFGHVRAVQLDALETRDQGDLPAVVNDELQSGESLRNVVGVDT